MPKFFFIYYFNWPQSKHKFTQTPISSIQLTATNIHLTLWLMLYFSFSPNQFFSSRSRYLLPPLVNIYWVSANDFYCDLRILIVNVFIYLRNVQKWERKQKSFFVLLTRCHTAGEVINFLLFRKKIIDFCGLLKKCLRLLNFVL